MKETRPSPLMKERISAVVHAPVWQIKHQYRQTFRNFRNPPFARYKNGEIDYKLLGGHLERYTDDLRVYVEGLPKVRGTKEIDTFNKASFNAHRTIMKMYFNVLWQNENFRNLLDGKPLEFLYLLVDLHDFARFIMNGQYSLAYTERVSDGLEKWILKHIFGEKKGKEMERYFHTVKWITGEEEPPHLDYASNSQKIALILKFIDTISKGSNGQLINPNIIFEENGSYENWLNLQKKLKRLPIENAYKFVDGNLLKWRVTPDSYRENDRKLTNDGRNLLESLLGSSFDYVYKKVRKRTRDLHLFNH